MKTMIKRLMMTAIISIVGCLVFAQVNNNASTDAGKHAQWRDYIEKKQFEKIIEQAGKLQQADSANFTTMSLLGQAYEGLLKYKDAYNSFKVCYELDSTRIEMLNSLARNASNIGKIGEAIIYYKQVLESDSANFYANYQLGRLYVTLDRYKEALKYYDNLLENDPENTTILRAKGDCYTSMDFSELALENYWAANRTNVENASLAAIVVNLMLSLIDPDDLDDAIEICDTALYYNPGHKGVRQKKAMVYYVQKKYDQANDVYSELLDDGDSSYMTLKYCGFSRYYARKWQSAIEPLEKAYEMDPAAVDVCLLLGITLGRTRDPEKAFEYFDRAELLLAPNPAFIRMLVIFKAEMYCKTGDCNQGAEMYYLYWEEGERQMSWLLNIDLCYRRKSLEDMTDDERQRYLYIMFLHATELIENPSVQIMRMTTQNRYVLSVLKKYDEEMFFRGADNLPMVLPNNIKTTLTKEKLKEIIGKVSEQIN